MPLSTGRIDLFVKLYGDNLLSVRYGNYSRGNTKFKIKDIIVKDFVSLLDIEAINSPEYAAYQIMPIDISNYIHYLNWLDTNYIRNPFHLWLVSFN